MCCWLVINKSTCGFELIRHCVCRSSGGYKVNAAADRLAVGKAGSDGSRELEELQQQQQTAVSVLVTLPFCREPDLKTQPPQLQHRPPRGKPMKNDCKKTEREII